MSRNRSSWIKDGRLVPSASGWRVRSIVSGYWAAFLSWAAFWLYLLFISGGVYSSKDLCSWASQHGGSVAPQWFGCCLCVSQGWSVWQGPLLPSPFCQDVRCLRAEGWGPWGLPLFSVGTQSPRGLFPQPLSSWSSSWPLYKKVFCKQDTEKKRKRLINWDFT